LSYFWLALGAQAKYWPALLAPFLLRQERRLKTLALGAAAFLPSLLFALFSVYVFHLPGNPAMAMNCNPYTWNFLDESLTCWTPAWHLAINAVATYGSLAALAAGAATERRQPARLLAYLAPVGFLVYYKSINWATPWYLLMLPVFAAPIGRRWVRWCVLLLSLAEPIAWAGIAGAPIGWINPEPPAAFMWGGVGR